MSNNAMRAVVAVCAVALTVLAALYVFTSTPLCEVFASERAETYVQDPWFGDGEPPVRTDIYAERWFKSAGRCVEVKLP